jgi:uncharacterized repeat protein (TIGR02543 family)/uncharacterized repeat protein (TIGR01451 family)
MQYPVVADPYGKAGDGTARLISIGAFKGTASTGGSLNVMKAPEGNRWASARSVWNQFMYNSVNINDDLTVPRYPLNPATFFPGPDGQPGTYDDVQPFNSFIKQPTELSKNGTPLWITPDAVFDDAQIETTVDGNSISVTVCITNLGDAALTAPLYATLYRDTIYPDGSTDSNSALLPNGNIIKTDSLMSAIPVGETGCLTVSVPDITPYLPFFQLFVRINDKDGKYPMQLECNYGDSIRIRLNPAMHLMMKKHAALNYGPQDDGTYANPIPALFSDTVRYSITIPGNGNLKSAVVHITDTLPPYLKLVDDSYDIEAQVATLSGSQESISWDISGVETLDNYTTVSYTTVSYKATPESGANASQPLFVNRAWIQVNDTVLVPTNSAYHQGAGTSMVTFSAAAGGSIYNAEPQAVDYSTTARTGVLIVPDDGYRFAGWSHDAYVSHRGKPIAAASGITLYDTLAVYGDVELTARFEPETYLIRYHLHDGENASANPPAYTVESDLITLAAPRKTGDVFTGWTGSNGDAPQETVTIPSGTTGELEYYANYLYSGREASAPEDAKTDNIWSSGNEAYIRTSHAGSIARIYSPDGVLHAQRTIISAGTTKIRLEQGIYIVTLNNGAGRKIVIN